jgi:hypothetical protein
MNCNSHNKLFAFLTLYGLSEIHKTHIEKAYFLRFFIIRFVNRNAFNLLEGVLTHIFIIVNKSFNLCPFILLRVHIDIETFADGCPMFAHRFVFDNQNETAFWLRIEEWAEHWFNLVLQIRNALLNNEIRGNLIELVGHDGKVFDKEVGAS